MVKIRLARGTRRGEPFYRVVAIDGRKAATHAYLEDLGFWNKRENVKKIDKKGILAWVKKGAQVSPAVSELIA